MNTKSAFIAIIGKPNVGKSSLLNCIMGEKIAIVSNKPQTTRTKITGVLTLDETQFVFTDTPGFHKPKTHLGDNMVKAVKSSLSSVDCVVFVTDASKKLSEDEITLLNDIKNQPKVLVLNKMDLVKKDVAMAKTKEINDICSFDCCVPISVLQNKGIDILLKELLNFAEESVHFFPDDTLTDQPERVISSEIIREKILMCMQQEIPHGTAVVIEQMRQREDRDIIDIDATIYCEKDTHKGMIIGKQGSMLKRISTLARKELEYFLDIKVNLKCFVKVKENWRNSDNYIKNFGLNSQD
ncbi:MAG: GTPase Era [Oscillospiraceae bacterium]